MASTISLPPIKSKALSHGHQKKGRKRVVRLPAGIKKEGAEDFVYPDIFAGHWLVESPRRIQFEKTTLGVTSHMSACLQDFYDEVANIPEKYITKAKNRTKTLTDYVIPRVTKLANQIGMKVSGWKYGGSTIDDSQVIYPTEIDILVRFEKYKMKTDSMDPGYKFVPLKRFRQKDGSKPDQFRYGRSEDGKRLSTMIVINRMYDMIQRSLKFNTQVELQPLNTTTDSPQIVVTFKDKHRFNFIPATFLENEEAYLVTRPYMCDKDPSSETLWRLNYIEKERNLMALLDKADRGIRRKAFKILKALIKVEHTLHGLASYHIKTVLFHMFDQAVDHSPRWQRDSIETAFLDLLSELLHYIKLRKLPHFFNREYDLFENMDKRKLASLESRIAFLLDNPKELMRILKKRT